MAEVIAGYEIESELGRGGMGVVYRAHDATLGRPVALKLIKAESLADTDKERFLREARACSAINHPNIVTVYAAGEDNGRPYLAMEFLEGRTIREAIDEGPLPWEEAVGHMMGLLDALQRLHGEGIVHRDLKPDNIIVTKDGVAKLMDFGIARVELSKTLTVDGTTLGTVYYMSPEQAAGEKVDARSDIFSIAAVLCEMVTGKLPFEGEHPMSVMYSITNSPHRPLAESGVDLPAELDGIIEKAFAKDPKDRYPDAAAFRAALAALVSPATAGAGGLSRKSLMLKVILPAVIVLAGGITAAALFFGTRGPLYDRERAVNLNELGQKLQDDGKMTEAEAEYRKAFAADPTYAVSWNNLGFIAMQDGYLEEADSVLSEAIRLNPAYAVAHFNLGNVRWDLKDPKGAEEQFREAIRSDPDMVAAYNNLAALLLERGRPEEADAVVDAGLARRANDPFLLKKRGQIAFATNRDIVALNSWNDALAEIDRLADNPREARQVGAAVSNLVLLRTEVHASLGMWYEKHGELEQAEEHWRAVAESDNESDRRQAAEALQRIRSR